MEHIEEAGIHSGDSACVLPPFTLGRRELDEVREATRRLAAAIGVTRVLSGVHFIRDVIGGAAIGLLIGTIGFFIF